MPTVHTIGAEKVDETVLARAIDSLSKLADLDFASTADLQLAFEQKDQGTASVLKTVRWLHKKNAERLLRKIRDGYKVFYDYFKKFRNQYPTDHEKKIALQGLRTIMFLADEAADNFERYSDIFVGLHSGSARKTPEFKKLCSLYASKIEPLITQYKIRSLPIHGLFSKKLASTLLPLSEKNAKALVVPIEAVKQDMDYELLYLRKTDGSRFCSPALLKNLRLACDIEQLAEKKGGEAIEDEIQETIRDQDVHDVHTILTRLHMDIDNFFAAARKAKDHPLMLQLYAACIALMMASVQGIHSHNTGGKEVHDYVKDFKVHLLKLYHDPEFKRLMAYPPQNEKSWEYVLFRLSEDLSSLLSKGLPLAEKAFEAFSTILSQATQGFQSKTLGEYLNDVYEGLSDLTSSTKSYRLNQMLHEIDDATVQGFEPFIGGSFPTLLCNLSLLGKHIPVIRLPSPTKQEYINKAYPSEIFQSFLRTAHRRGEKSLIINLNDSKSGKSSSRFFAINELGEEWQNSLQVINCSEEDDFYLQAGVYEDRSSAEEFKTELCKYFLRKDGSGHSLRTLFPNILVELRAFADIIHRYLFDEKSTLTKQMRMEFVDIIQLFLVLKAIGKVQPDRIFISCKDGIDVTLPLVCALSCLVWTLSGNELSATDKDWLMMIEFGLPLMLRHRVVFEDRYNRFMGVISLLAPFSSAKSHMLERHLLPAIDAFLKIPTRQMSLEPYLEN